MNVQSRLFVLACLPIGLLLWRLNQESYQAKLQELRDYVTNYDYEVLFQ